MRAKFAIIGKGFIYPRHVQAIQECGGEVFMTCDIDERKHGNDAVGLFHFLDWLEMFNSPRFDEVTHVSVLTPNYLHSTIAREALLRGKQVLCEKPLSINGLEGMQGVKTVLQLRHHPELQKINKPKRVQVVAKMYRDDKYWSSWKGNPILSGGVLYNLGVHYVDLLIFLMGDSWKILWTKVTEKLARGVIEFESGVAEFHIEIVDSKEKQGRLLLADGKEIVLSNQENLSYEDLHKHVYREFLAGRGIGVEEAGKSLKLIGAILKK